MLAPRSARVLLLTLGTAFVVGALFLLDIVGGLAYAATVGAAALAVTVVSAALTRGSHVGLRWLRGRMDLADLLVIAVLYALVVGGFLLAFTTFTTGNVLGLFLSFGAALLVGTVGPIIYTVWMRQRPLTGLGIGLGDWRLMASLALVFAAVQFGLTLARLDYPSLETWLPLLVMAITVGLFEAIFFRGFVQRSSS